ncbi:hypothetical protein GOBAR_DD01693 [Gossypium barbadense]|nr:hypothetical protein GOBAR_DD01693 [Gossypium barbadense]
MTNTAPEVDCLSNDNDIYGSWMIVERCNRLNVLENHNEMENLQEKRHREDLVNKINGAGGTGAKEPQGKGKVGHIDVQIGSDLASAWIHQSDKSGDGVEGPAMLNQDKETQLLL